MAPAVTAPVRVPPWDEPWVRALGLSKPMFITLYDVARSGFGTGTVRPIYPGGQWRLIRAGLYRRGLIELDDRLTTCGHVAAVWTGVATRRYWPDGGTA
jgi:hypothetical protein